LGLGLNVFRSLVLTSLACSSAAPREVSSPNNSNRERPESAELAAGEPSPDQWPHPSRLFLLINAQQDLVLRAVGSDFSHTLAQRARHVLYDPEFELVWVSDEEKLWVLDLRDPSPSRVAPVLIAENLPAHLEIHVERAESFAESEDACDLAPILWVHWDAEPRLEGGQGQRSSDLAGRAWLVRERARAARSSGAARYLDPSGAHVALSTARARCESAEWCGAAQPMLGTGWTLVVTDQSEGDCWHFGCLAYDASKDLFGTPPHPEAWGPADGMPSGPCGPYRFDVTGTTFLVKDLLCVVGGSCLTLDGWAVGWLEPGDTLGTRG